MRIKGIVKENYLGEYKSEKRIKDNMRANRNYQRATYESVERGDSGLYDRRGFSININNIKGEI